MKEVILLDHGAGGKASHRLVSEKILPLFDNPQINAMDDGAVFDSPGPRLAMSCDTFVVDPIFFPGGDIGMLSVCGTVNDLAMCGATTGRLSLGMVIEEGFSAENLGRVLESIARTAWDAGFDVVTGDTKVVPKGAADGIFINTAGIGPVADGVRLSASLAAPGDRVILSGPMGAHGAAITACRNKLDFASEIRSDAAPLNGLVEKILATKAEVHALRDPTRGGVGTALNEIALACGHVIRIDEATLPVSEKVAAFCDILGLDPLYLANEGRLLCFVAEKDAETVLAAMRAHPLGREAAVIGAVDEEKRPMVFMKTRIGGARVVDMLSGEQLPRIC